MYQVFDARYIIALVDNEQRLKTTLTFVSKLECRKHHFEYKVYIFSSIPFKVKVDNGAAK